MAGPISKKQKSVNKYVLDASAPVKDSVFDIAAFQKFLSERIKVDGRTGNLNEKITISREGDGKIIVLSSAKFSGRYLKYLTKKYLKKNNLRDWLRVVATKRGHYELRFFQISVSDDEEDDE